MVRKEVRKELSSALEKQGAELKKAKKKLKKIPYLKDKAMLLEAAKRKNEKLTADSPSSLISGVCTLPNTPFASYGRSSWLARLGTAHERGTEEI